jgi:hypothetical protein
MPTRSKPSDLDKYVVLGAIPGVAPALGSHNVTATYREAWLTELAAWLRPVFKGWTLDPFRVTCGWPSRAGLGARRRVLGQCFAAENSKAGVYEIFVSPLLDDPTEVAGTLAHEMAHVAAGIPAGHSGKFVSVCKAVGLTKGKPTTAMPGPALAEHVSRLLEPLGPYPHKALVGVLKDRKEKPDGRVRLACPGCGFVCDTTARRLAECKACPTCGCGCPMAVLEKGGDGG